jgi:hypothetical protein
MMFITKNGEKLEEVIKRAMDDHVVTNSEYQEIINLAHQDGIIDQHEQLLLAEFKKMISQGFIERVP